MTQSQVLALCGPVNLEIVNVIGVRGYRYTNSKDNKRGIYDDALFIVAPGHFSSYRANVDPSIHRAGIATLAPGVYDFKPGKRNTGPSAGSLVFRPTTPNEALPVTRDGSPAIVKGFSILFHPGPENGTGSDGCQTIPKVDWSLFSANVVGLLKRFKLPTFKYHLIYPD
jgi:hypothetical protein